MSPKSPEKEGSRKKPTLTGFGSCGTKGEGQGQGQGQGQGRWRWRWRCEKLGDFIFGSENF